MAQQARDFYFDSGHIALDLALSGGPDWRKRWERLHQPEDLEAWLAESSLTLTAVTANRDDLNAAFELRSALWDAGQACGTGKTPPPAAVDTINSYAKLPRLTRQLGAGGRAEYHHPTASEALATVATEAVELFGTDSGATVHRCQGDRCYLLFVDTSPSQRRRWCSMQRCGNRTKVRRHRAETG